jgi:hypothetical protein
MVLPLLWHRTLLVPLGISVWSFQMGSYFSLTSFALFVSASLLVVAAAFWTRVTKAAMLSFDFWRLFSIHDTDVMVALIFHALLKMILNSFQCVVISYSVFVLLYDGMASSHHTATSFLKLLTQCPMAASLFHAGFAAFLLAISLSRSAAPICFHPSYSLVSLSPEKMRTSSRVVDTIAPGSAILDFPCGDQLMIGDDCESCHAAGMFPATWFRLVILGLDFSPYLVLSFKQVFSKLRFPVPFTSFPLFSLSVTFVKVFLLL